MESLPNLSLEIINIASFVEGLIFYQSTSPEFKYGDGKVLSTQPHPTLPLIVSTSTHCVPNLNLIKSKFNMLF